MFDSSSLPVSTLATVTVYPRISPFCWSEGAWRCPGKTKGSWTKHCNSERLGRSSGHCKDGVIHVTHKQTGDYTYKYNFWGIWNKIYRIYNFLSVDIWKKIETRVKWSI